MDPRITAYEKAQPRGRPLGVGCNLVPQGNGRVLVTPKDGFERGSPRRSGRYYGNAPFDVTPQNKRDVVRVRRELVEVEGPMVDRLYYAGIYWVITDESIPGSPTYYAPTEFDVFASNQSIGTDLAIYDNSGDSIESMGGSPPNNVDLESSFVVYGAVYEYYIEGGSEIYNLVSGTLRVRWESRKRAWDHTTVSSFPRYSFPTDIPNGILESEPAVPATVTWSIPVTSACYWPGFPGLGAGDALDDGFGWPTDSTSLIGWGSIAPGDYLEGSHLESPAGQYTGFEEVYIDPVLTFS